MVAMRNPAEQPSPDWSRTSSITDAVPIGVADGAAVIPDGALMYASFAYFLGRLVDDEGKPLQVPVHIQEWADTMQRERLMVLMAARDHAKS